MFWLNFFGRPYVELLGEERLRSASNAAAIGDGFLVAVGDDLRRWDDPSVVILEQQVRDHLGPDLFFTKGEPDRQGVVPTWRLK